MPILKLVFFLVPITIFFAFPIFIFIVSGEFISVDERIRRQQIATTELLTSKSYFPYPKKYGYTSFLAVKPDVATIGNSRVLQLRNELFIDDITLFHPGLGGGAVGLVQMLRSSWDLLDQNENLKIIIIGLDQDIFRKGIEEEVRATPPPVFSLENPEKQNVLYAMRELYKDYFHGKFNVREILTARARSNAIGIQALILGEGTRRDGSFRYGNIVDNPEDLSLRGDNFRVSLDRIDTGTNIFKYDSEVSEYVIDELRFFLDEAVRRNIHVVLFLPPYAPTVWGRIILKGDSLSYIQKIMPTLKRELAGYPFPVFDFMDAERFGSRDMEFLDGVHGSEKVYLRMFIVMAKGDPLLGAFVDLPKLRKILRESTSDLEVFSAP